MRGSASTRYGHVLERSSGVRAANKGLQENPSKHVIILVVTGVLGGFSHRYRHADVFVQKNTSGPPKNAPESG